MRAFVTGGTGFVGANLIRLLLQQGYQVKALVRANSCLVNLKDLDIEIVRGDLNQEDLALQMKGCQVLFHVAAQYSLWKKDRDTLYLNNVLGTRNILNCARQAGIERTIYTSSVAAMGVRQDSLPADETYQSPVSKLIGDYKKSKYYGEQEAVKAIKTGQDIVIVNPSTPIGAWDIKPTPTGEIIVRFLQRKMPFYIDTGLNLIDVEDVAWGHVLALKQGKTGDRYILGNQNLTFAQLLGKLEQITGLPAPQKTIPGWIPYGVAWLEENVLTKLGKQPTIALDGVRMSRQKMFYDASKAVVQLGLPQSNIDDALFKAVKYFQTKGISNEGSRKQYL
ncbi:NAD-dependent epimerase/dehydratase family protein [Waterburya agarophytonicola K14]|uniref:NAD-dependent epimerase/dehydratase family protein n=1 Tax=Waterburya agarophytonicola KI4 TaxID=2874699 RepID=A0A964FHB7_9CYAN|nr:hopanoid-associated sugar epimerase [Waterburya agarophytonicola]MCC0178917.1 NAD-dependent epimerase/dehydratase family protein [Waterburya agarophytonicola KI4]